MGISKSVNITNDGAGEAAGLLSQQPDQRQRQLRRLADGDQG